MQKSHILMYGWPLLKVSEGIGALRSQSQCRRIPVPSNPIQCSSLAYFYLLNQGLNALEGTTILSFLKIITLNCRGL
jgi:hypothetical protein